MSRFARIVMMCLLAFVVASPAAAQGLTARINAVRAQYAQRKAPQSPEGKILQRLLYRTVDLDFEEVPARDVFEYLGTVLDLRMEVRYSDDPAGYGIDPKTPITVRAEGVQGLEALEDVLDQCSGDEEDECTWQIRRNFLEVGTKERLSVPKAQVVRVYRVDSMLFEPNRHDNAPYLGIWLPQYDGFGGGWGGGVSGSFGGATGGAYTGTGTGGRVVGGYGGGMGTGGGPPNTGTTTIANTPSAVKQRADQLVDLIVTTIEPLAWLQNGGEWASIQYADGGLVVRAPDFIQRQIGGYPRVPPPAGSASRP